MINKEDLRLGNQVNYEATAHIITGLLDEVCISEWSWAEESDPYTHPYSELTGILITEELLEKIPEFKKSGRWYSNLWLDLQVQEKETHVRIVTGPESKYLKHITYLHELQNLYYILSGERISITK